MDALTRKSEKTSMISGISFLFSDAELFDPAKWRTTFAGDRLRVKDVRDLSGVLEVTVYSCQLLGSNAVHLLERCARAGRPKIDDYRI
jgi:hypothetical protein